MSSSATSRISTQEIRNIVDRLKYQKHRNTTKKNYYSIWNIFSKFCLRLDIRPASWEDRIVLFVGYMIENGRQSSTVKSYISAMKYVLQEDGFDISLDQYLISSLTRACNLKNDEICTRLLIDKALLHHILDKVQSHFLSENQPYLSLLYQTLFSTAYFGLLRVGEVTKGNHPVLAQDIHVATNKRKMLIVLRTSKTHGCESQPQMITITSTRLASTQQATHSYCPYTVLDKYAKMRGPYMSDSEQFFVFSDGMPVTPRHMRECLRKILKLCGENANLFCTHSLRIGRSCDLLKLGLSIEIIKKLQKQYSNTSNTIVNNPITQSHN